MRKRNTIIRLSSICGTILFTIGILKSPENAYWM
jgi:hypothetical protein